MPQERVPAPAGRLGGGWARPGPGPRPAASAALRANRKTQLEFLPHRRLTFHKDFQKPDSQPETQTLWAGRKKHTEHTTISALGGQQTCTRRETHTPAAPTSPPARARGPAPSRSRPRAARAQKPAPSGTGRGFRPEARPSPFGSGPSSTLARKPRRSLHIRDQRLAPACISGADRR